MQLKGFAVFVFYVYWIKFKENGNGKLNQKDYSVAAKSGGFKSKCLINFVWSEQPPEEYREKKVFLKILQISKENICVGVSF